MTNQDVSVVIPSIGRPSLHAAVTSALQQTVPPREVIVVLDRDGTVEVPESDSVIVLRTEGGVGPARARQLGVTSASGDIIALLDDDDLWLPDKLRVQLAAAPSAAHWIVSSRVAFDRSDDSTVFPRRLIGVDEPVADYLCQFKSFRFGGASLQTSTLVFPRSVALAVPLSIAAGSVHDDPLWLMAVRKAMPDIPIVHCGDVLVEYGVTDDSLSRSTTDRSREYVEWGLDHLADVSPRTRGDYLVTSPVAAAIAADSMKGAVRALAVGLRRGRPGPGACTYAVLGIARIGAKRVAGRIERLINARRT